MIALKENVYLVNGATNAAIYDFNKNCLYSISQEAKRLLNSVLYKDTEAKLNEYEKKYLQELLSKNIIQNEDRPLHTIDELKENPVIDFVWIELTTACNLKCIHCYDESTCNRTEFLEFDDFCTIINQIEDLGIKKIQLIGGEPFFLGDKLVKYLDYVKEKFEYIEIFTNGTLIDDKWYTYLKENNIRLALSVYSYNKEYHDKVTNVLGSWQKTNEVISKIEENGIRYRVRNVIMKDVEIGEKNTNLYELIHKKDIVRMTGRANMNLLSDELLKRKLITRSTFSGYLNKNFVTRLISGHNCFSRRLYFGADLEVYPCVMERRISHGSLKKQTLKEVLNNDILNIQKDKIEGCKDCEFRYCCFDCRPNSLGKDVLSKPWYCTYNPHNGEWEDIDDFIKHLKNNED